MGHVTLSTPVRGRYVIPRLALDIFYMHTKFGDSHFSRSSDMNVGVEIENVTPTTPVLRVVCHPNPRF